MSAVPVSAAMPRPDAARPAIEILEQRLLLSAAPIHPRAHHPVHVASHLLHPLKKGDGNEGGDQGNGDSHHAHPKPKPKPKPKPVNHSGDGDENGNGGGSTAPSGSTGGPGSSGGSSSTGGSGSSSGTTGSSSSGGTSSSPAAPPPAASGSPHTPISAGPTASIFAPDITTPGAGPQSVTVTYSGSTAVNSATIGLGNLTVTGPAGTLLVTGASAGMPSGSTLIATYTIAPPAAGWTSAANGTYTIGLKANQVFDTSGASAGGAQGSFKVQIAAAPTATGSQDPTFGGGNTVNPPFVTEAIVPEPSGKMLVVGHKGDATAGQAQGIIEQLNADGSLDTTFGTKGQIVTAPAANEEYFAAAWQDAKHFVVAGTGKGDFVIRRYNLNGSLDASFGAKGTATADFGSSTDTARAIAIGAGGSITVGGDSAGNFAFARFLPGGQPDSNFAQSGRQLFGLGNGDNGLGAIVLQSDGKIVAAGAEGTSVVVVRLTSAGEADGTFGASGMATVASLAARTDLGQPDRSEGLALADNGEILVANRTTSGNFGLERLNTNGTIDTTFGVKGLATADFGGDDDADSIIVELRGQILVVGTSLQSSSAQTAVAAFDSSGAPLTNFGNQGLATFPSGISATGAGTIGGITPKSLHVGDIVLKAFGSVTPDGRVVIGTTNQAVAATTSSTLRRLLVPGADAAASGSGTLLGSFGLVNGHAQSLTATIAGAHITFVLTGGTANAYQDGSQIRLAIDDAGKGVALSIISTGDRVALGDVAISGTLRSMKARTSDLAGNLHVTGSVGTIALGDVTGNVFSGASIANLSAANLKGTVFATEAIGRAQLTDVTGTIASGSGVIGKVFAASLSNARILSGANLGGDGLIGGTGAGEDTFAAGSIGSLHVSGDITSSFVGAGVDPVDSTFGNADDKAAASPATAASLIRLLSARSADSASRFEATSFGQITLGKKIDPKSDVRFRQLT